MLYRFILIPTIVVAFAPACSGESTTDTPSGPATTVDSGTPTAEASTSTDSGSTPPPKDSGTTTTDSSTPGTCTPPTGDTCPTTAGNCKGIGTPCTKGGKQCDSLGLQCDVDLDAKGKGICISILKCTPNKGDCGKGATCCSTATTSFISVCLPNACLADDCTAEP